MAMVRSFEVYLTDLTETVLRLNRSYSQTPTKKQYNSGNSSL
jgi:hypothetical protein